MFAAASCIDQCGDNRTVAAASIERLLDGDHLRIRSGATNKVEYAAEAFIGMVEEHVSGFDGAEDVALGKEQRFKSLIRRILQGRTIETAQSHEFRHGHWAFDAKKLERQKFELIHQEVGQRSIGAGFNFKTDHIAEAALVNEVLDGG